MTIIIGGILLWNGKDLAGLSTVIAALTAIVVSLVVAKGRQRSQLDERRSQGQAKEEDSGGRSERP